MATRASKTVIKAWRVLELMGQTPSQARTVPGLARASAGELSPDEVEGALLAFAEVGAVQRLETESGMTFWLLGAAHLRLAMAEIDSLLGATSALREALGADGRLLALRRLINLSSNAEVPHNDG